MDGALRAYFPHLRLPFQLTLAPIFLWGVLLSGARWDGGTTCGFVALHLFLYPAATAFNSAFDRDLGPVAGLASPPQAPPLLAAFAVVLALAGLPLALAAGLEFAVLYALIVGWTAAYSHPRTRWKASPWKSAAAIALGQGALGFAAGWAASAGPDAPLGTFLTGSAGAALTALGLYPVTQVFQIGEDRLRGDRTLAVVLGTRGALRLGGLCLLIAGAVTAWLVGRLYGPSDAVLIVLGYLGLIVAQQRLARGPAYRSAMRLLNWATAGFLLFIVLEAVGNG